MKLIPFIALFIFTLAASAQVSDFESINFEKADRIALKYKNEGLQNLPDLSYKLTSTLSTDAERFRAIYRWVCNNISNDYGLYTKNTLRRSRYKDDSLKLSDWNNNFKKRLFKTLIKDKRTICTGYAYIVKELSRLANLECEIIQGFGKTSMTDVKKLDTPNHSWNTVKLNGKWYLCDATWASGLPDPETNKFTFNYNDGFFLASPKLFAVNHYPVEKKWTLLETESPTFESFLKAPVIYGKAYTNLIQHNAPIQMHSTIHKNETVTFKYQLKESAKTRPIRFLIDDGFNNNKVKPTSTTREDAALILDYKFEKRGFYDVHLFIGNDLVSTYTVKVIGRKN